ncbi:hypothetical protein [Caldicellulosiruptor hydrothermalis]|nr:hypothetical protein [Caldicellulosiruptor hydrothermalis]
MTTTILADLADLVGLAEAVEVPVDLADLEEAPQAVVGQAGKKAHFLIL